MANMRMLLAVAAVLLSLSASVDAKKPKCGPGQEPGPNGRVVRCKPGFNKRGSGSYKCVRCDRKTTEYQPRSGATRCLTCPAKIGKVDLTRTKCIPRAGFYVGRNGLPTACPAGTAKGSLSFAKCTPCNRGNLYQPKSGQLFCLRCIGSVTKDRKGCVANPGYQQGPRGSEPCPPGTAKPGRGNSACRLCSGDRQFQPFFGARSCGVCPRGVVNPRRTFCTAGPGYQPGRGPYPEPCPRGYAKRGTFNGKCVKCLGTGPKGGQKYCDIRGAQDCFECPKGGTVSSDRTKCIPPKKSPSPPPPKKTPSPPPPKKSPPPPKKSPPPPKASPPPPKAAASPPPPAAGTPPGVVTPPAAATPPVASPPPPVATPPVASPPPAAASPPPPVASPPPPASSPPPPAAGTPPAAASPPPPVVATPPPDASTPPPDVSVPPPDFGVPPPDFGVPPPPGT